MLTKSALVTQWSGSIGGMTGSHNRGGMYLRARTIPVNPNSPGQQSSRSALASLTSGWSSLTQAQRDGWEVYAANVPVINALGDARIVTAINAYVGANVPRITATAASAVGSLATVDDAPTIYDVGSFTPITLAIATSIADITFDNTDDWANEDGAGMLIQSGPPVNPTINFFRTPYRYGIISIIEGDSTTAPTSPFTTLPTFPAIVGQRQYMRVRVSRADGRLSAPQTISAIAT